MTEYTRENYEAYCEMIRTDPVFKGMLPSSYEHWKAFNEAMDMIEGPHQLDGVPYQERHAD